MSSLFRIFYVLAMQAITYLVFNWVGLTYLEAEMPRIDNENILDNIKEGVVIIDEQSSSTRFLNRAVALIDKELQDTCALSIWKDEKTLAVDLDQEKFVLLER